MNNFYFNAEKWEKINNDNMRSGNESNAVVYVYVAVQKTLLAAWQRKNVRGFV